MLCERAKSGACSGSVAPDGGDTLKLTDAEREAIATAAAVCEGVGFDELPATLRGLLERLGGGE
jgi:hypothetical protein